MIITFTIKLWKWKKSKNKDKVASKTYKVEEKEKEPGEDTRTFPPTLYTRDFPVKFLIYVLLGWGV